MCWREMSVVVAGKEICASEGIFFFVTYRLTDPLEVAEHHRHLQQSESEPRVD
jgi:hypothetical protein